MPHPTVDLYWRQETVRLVSGGPTLVVPEGIVSLRVTLPYRTTISFDDEPLAAVWSANENTAYAQIDLTNRVGFHRIALKVGVETISYDFQTSTTKATWDEINNMATHIARHVFAFRRQFHYTLPDGTRRVVPLPELEFGWLRDRVPEIRRLVDDIAGRPGIHARSRVLTSLQGRHVAVAQTLKHLRENPRLMEVGPNGPLEVNGATYWPASVKVHVLDREPARKEHEQIAHFLRTLANACTRLQDSVPEDVQPILAELNISIAAARQHTVIKRNDAPRLRAPWSPVPTILQRMDSRYGRLRGFQAEYMMNIAPGERGDNATRANIRDAWEIYQAFCAHLIGCSLKLEYASRRNDLRDRDRSGRSMIGTTVDLYYDSRPPEKLLPSWRGSTSRPSAERPDIILVDRVSGKAVVLDVKFRTDAKGVNANSGDLQEMQGYMNNYGLPAGGIVFPGAGVPRRHSGFGYSLVELPLRPTSDHDALLEQVGDTIATMWSVPNF